MSSSSVTYPSGQTLTSSALTPDTLLLILQPLTCAMLGINPPDYSLVRLEWPQTGQPGWGITDDICFLRAIESDEAYSRIRDIQNATNTLQSVLQTITYTRVWQVSWQFYGPTSFDHARQVNDALFLDFTHDTLAAQNLYLVTDAPRPVYAPELFQGQWWKRADLECKLNELVTATITASSISTSEVLVYAPEGQVADLTT